MKKPLILLLAMLVGILTSHHAVAAKCTAPKAGPDLSAEEMATLYDCLHPKLVAAYGKKGHEVGSAYGDWQAASLHPEAPGVHSGQYLMTYVNEVGYTDYIRYAADGSQMPVGTVIAKENFTIKSNGKIKRGPLLIMTKVGDAEPDTGGWKYSGVKPNGKVLKVDGKGFCHACHQAYPTQDYLGYPVPASRVAAN